MTPESILKKHNIGFIFDGEEYRLSGTPCDKCISELNNWNFANGVLYYLPF